MLKFLQIVAAVLGGWAAVFLDVTNGYIIGACAMFSAMLMTFAFQRVNYWWMTGSLRLPR